jgi:hypothetical protein
VQADLGSGSAWAAGMERELSLEEVDSRWDTEVEAPETPRRRLGERVAVNLWALLQARGRSLYAQVVELSPTGVVLRLVGIRSPVRFRGEQRFGLDLFLPGSPAPLHATVRPARAIGVLEAFELLEISAIDRLTLAEYLDRIRTSRPLLGHVRASHPGTLPLRA